MESDREAQPRQLKQPIWNQKGKLNQDSSNSLLGINCGGGVAAVAVVVAVVLLLGLVLVVVVVVMAVAVVLNQNSSTN